MTGTMSASAPPVSAGRIREMFAAIDARRWDELQAFFHPRMTYLRPGYAPITGLAAVLHFYEHERVIASGTHLLGAILVDGAHGASFGRFVGTHRNGSALDEEFADRYEFAEGLVLRRQSFFFRPAI